MDLARLNPILCVVHAPTAVATAGTSETCAFYTAEFPGQVVAAQICLDAALTGHATDYVTISVRKGTTVMFTFVTDTPTTDDIAADVPKAMVPATAVADRRFAAGDVLNVIFTKAGSGVAVSGRVTVALMQSAYDHSEGA